MKLLISGATGLVGQAIVKEALRKKHSVNFLTTRKNKVVNHKNLKGFYWNPETNEIDATCFEQVDVVIHLAGASISKRWTKAYKKTILNSRVKSTQLLHDAIKELKAHQIKSFIAASAVGCYPASTEVHYTENFPIAENTFLEEVVCKWEQETDTVKTLGINITKLRIGLVLSTLGGVLHPLKLPTKMGFGAAFGNGKQGQSWIHIDDLVAMFLFFCQTQQQGVYNAVSPNPIDQNTFMRSYAKALNAPYFMPPLPGVILKAVMGEMSSLVLNSHWISAEKVTKAGFKFKFQDINLALSNVIEENK